MEELYRITYADLTFDGYRLMGIGRRRSSRSPARRKSASGWRLGFACGNPRLIHALARIKSYLDYGVFQPIQIAGIIALEGPQACVAELVETYRNRRDVLVNGLARAGWKVDKPRGTMFVWAPIPDAYRGLGSLEFAKLLLSEAKVAVSPGIGFGEYGEGFVRFALVENEAHPAGRARHQALLRVSGWEGDHLA